MKYPKENRFSLGCAKVELLENNTVVGLRAEMFDYSGKWMLSVGEAREKEQDECARVKALLGPGGQWVTGLRTQGEVWMDDSIDMLKGVGAVARGNFEAAGIRTVADMFMAPEDTSIKGFTRSHLDRLRQQAERAQQGAFPADRVIDHRLSDNPYKSRYGGAWREEI